MMGNEIFGLAKRPFIAEPVLEAYCPFGSMDSARSQIFRCVERQEGIALVTGLSGTGKTLLCKTIQNEFSGKLKTVLLNGKNLHQPKAFLESVLGRLNIPFVSNSLASMRDALTAVLETGSRFRSGILLLIDDAQSTGIRVFEEIRQLLDLTLVPEQGVRVVLVGDASLEEKLGFVQLNSFSQRITTRCFLETMNRDETTAFLNQELKQAGDSKGLFSRDVCREIHRYSQGVPRVTNQLADLVLVLAQEMVENPSGSKNQTRESVVHTEEDPNIVKFEAWDSDVPPMDSVEEELFSESLDENTFTEGKNFKQKNALPSIQITPELVQKAWRKLQQIPEESTTSGRCESENFSVGNQSGIPEEKNSTKSVGNSGAIEFGSLDDDLDSDPCSIFGSDFSTSAKTKNKVNSSQDSDLATGNSSVGESAEDATMIWSYDEMQSVRDAVEAANRIPEEWNASARENAQLEEARERAAVAEAEKATSSKVFQAESHILPRKDVTRYKSTEISNDESDPDSWNVFKETANIRFPDSKEPAWSTSSYSTSQPASQAFTSAVSRPAAVPVSNTVSVLSPGIVQHTPLPSTRALTVDEMIYDAIMDDTVHSMGLLQNILRAIREEGLKTQRVTQPQEYWLALQDTSKELLRNIARERAEKHRISPTQTELNPKENYISGRKSRSDFYRPETLIEKETAVPGVSPKIPVSRNREEEYSKKEEGFGSSSDVQDVTLLRKLLQDSKAREGFDPEAQEKILDIISRLQTMNQ